MASLIVSIVALIAASLSALRVFLGSKPSDTAPAPVHDDSEVRGYIHSLAESIDEVRADYTEFRSMVLTAVDEGIRDVKRRENRVRATVRRAREELADGGSWSPGLEAEAGDLLAGDAGRGGSEAVPPVPTHMAGPEPGNRFAQFPGAFDGFDLS